MSNGNSNKGFIVGPVVYTIGLLAVASGIGIYGVSSLLHSSVTINQSTKTDQRMTTGGRAIAAASVLCTGTGEVVNGTTCSQAGYTPPAPDAFPASDPQLPNNGDSTFMGAESGIIPATSPAPKTDAWGRLVAYCHADSASLTGTTATIATNPAYALVSAGADGTLDTTCSQALGDDPQNDDKVQRLLVADAMDLSTAWNKASDSELTFGAASPSTARIGIGTATPSKQLDVNGDATISGDLDVGGATNLSGNITTSGDISASNITASGNVGVAGAISGNSASLTNPLGIGDGGTGAATAPGARTSLGATATGDALFTAADAPAARATLGLDDMALQNSGFVAVTGGSISGLSSLDIADTGTDLAIADGGTSASTPATARANLGADNATNLLNGTVDPSRLPTTTGDVAVTRTDATTEDATVVGLQGRAVETAAPADGEGLGWDSGTNSWKPMVLGVPATGDTGAVSGQHDHDARYYTQPELNTSGGGGAVHWDNVTNKPTFTTSLASLTDTTLASLGDGQVLYYDAGSSSWKNGNVDGVPIGTVAAFDSATCPTGWSDFTPANGRFIVGVGASTDAGGYGATYALGDSGGENRHQLTVDEMPSHQHEVPHDYDSESTTLGISQALGGGDVVSWRGLTDLTGGDSAHENRPPYVALRYCKKTVQTTAPLPNAPSVEGLSNTNVSGLQNGQALLWDAANLEWTNADIPSAPLGTVSAFNLATCPSGWRRFTEADGRFIVATGTSSAGGSQTYVLGDSGGENAHQLTVAEMPSHSHTADYAAVGSDNTGLYVNRVNKARSTHGSQSSGDTGIDANGGDTPHENRPPFYALTLCEKITAPLNPYAEQPWMMSGTDTYFNGNVGIGTTSPQAKLDVAGRGQFLGTAALRLKADDTNDHVYMEFYPRSAAPTTRGGYIGFPNAGASQLMIHNELPGGIRLGTSQNADAVTIHDSGKVGIGTTAPLSPLTIVNTGALVRLQDSDATVNTDGINAGIALRDRNESALGYMGFGTSGQGMTILNYNTTSSSRFHAAIYEPGVGTVAGMSASTTGTYLWAGGAYNLVSYDSGNAWIRGSLTQNSDRTLKRDIRPISPIKALEALRHIPGVRFNWKHSGKADIGFIAQDVEPYFPELVTEGEEGKKALKYANMNAVLVAAIKELDDQNQRLNERISDLEGGAPDNEAREGNILWPITAGFISLLIFVAHMTYVTRRRDTCS